MRMGHQMKGYRDSMVTTRRNNRRHYLYGRLPWSEQQAERNDTIQTAKRMIADAGAGIRMRQITRDASFAAPYDNALYLDHVAARIGGFADPDPALIINNDWPAPDYVYFPNLGEPHPQRSDGEWCDVEPGFLLQYELYVSQIAERPLAQVEEA